MVDAEVIRQIQKFRLADRNLPVHWKLAQVVLAPAIHSYFSDLRFLSLGILCVELDGFVLAKNAKSFSQKVIPLCHMLCKNFTCDFTEF